MLGEPSDAPAAASPPQRIPNKDKHKSALGSAWYAGDKLPKHISKIIDLEADGEDPLRGMHLDFLEEEGETPESRAAALQALSDRYGSLGAAGREFAAIRDRATSKKWDAAVSAALEKRRSTVTSR